MAKQGPLSGQQVANRYWLGELLGSGGMGTVYKAQDTRLNRPVAMKVMSPAGRVSAADLQHFTQLFQAEALRLAGLKHPGIPHIYDHFEEGGHWFLAMEFIEGETLKDYLQGRGGRLQVDEVLKIGLQLADVLHYLHLRQPPIIFRDLKPANVMIAPDGQVFLIDFGIARLFTPGKSRDTYVLLTPGYAAPEQHGTAQTTVRSDIYSLGATLHHLLGGTLPVTSPFHSASLSIQPPAQLALLIAQMMAFDAAIRPATMAEVKDELQRMIDQTAQPPTKKPIVPTALTLPKDSNSYVSWGGDHPVYSDTRGDRIWTEFSNEIMIGAYKGAVFEARSLKKETNRKGRRHIVPCKFSIDHDFVVEMHASYDDLVSVVRMLINEYSFWVVVREKWAQFEIALKDDSDVGRTIASGSLEGPFVQSDGGNLIAFVIQQTNNTQDIRAFVDHQEITTTNAVYDFTPDGKHFTTIRNSAHKLDEEGFRKHKEQVAKIVRKELPFEIKSPYKLELCTYSKESDYPSVCGRYGHTKIWIKAFIR